ncbi:hypothetical protein EJB05_42172 [Eragrostis curvula]|uniref:Uncharacterized protein n=2 Tax=Eragrostis curvula TaxID=38414 RepID=A0A5J9TBI6_9POAL|nr:hypothetical protein EJB05_42172 [Eragrostis curvula]
MILLFAATLSLSLICLHAAEIDSNLLDLLKQENFKYEMRQELKHVARQNSVNSKCWPKF